MAHKTVSVGKHRVETEKLVRDRLASLKLAYQFKHKTNINIKTIVERLVLGACLKDIEDV